MRRSRSKVPSAVAAYTRVASTSITAKSGVKIIVRTGAMFSTTCCFDSTSHAATTTAPAAPDGITHFATCSKSISVGPRIPAVRPISTIPPSAIRV